MRTSDFNYHLPEELIAQRPIRPRDSSRLLIFNRATGEIKHQVFRDVTKFLSAGDILVLNETRVLPARLHAKKIPSGGSVEILLLNRLSERIWEVIVGGRRVRSGLRLQIAGGPELTILKEAGKGKRIVEFAEPILDKLEEIGVMPLPPYIHTPLREQDEYQTIFARVPGSSAAPTAGLHFTDNLLNEIRNMDVTIAKVTLHVGLDTFAPVSEDSPHNHPIHQEWCQVTKDAAEMINQVSSSGGRVIAIGTTSVRTLETAARSTHGKTTIHPYEGHTGLYILPGYRFKAVDSIITNFHLPKSTLLMMLSAFTGREKMIELYEEAIRRKYRFYSFGDAMFIR
ncbi:MAG: tRNA preQ1(34) S-adenosylmethionine ribosyltransferase-isomerase QueA [Anaerolineales bacterium]|nr:tRNA preQ1(34) S-adenosylmethionine ribosyltransferase-isomerase QueA [Anaerolineales bacterium]